LADSERLWVNEIEKQKKITKQSQKNFSRSLPKKATSMCLNNRIKHINIVNEISSGSCHYIVDLKL
jgi:hypothetical protein